MPFSRWSSNLEILEQLLNKLCIAQIPIHTHSSETGIIRSIHHSIQGKRTGTERVVRPLELLTRDVVVALGTNALEVVRVILVTKDRHVKQRIREKIKLSTNSLSGSCLGNELGFPRQCF